MSVRTDTRRCAWKLDNGAQCAELAKPRGKRGPIPRYCEEHTKARKRAISHNPVKPRASRPECCRDGVCEQHAQQREYDRVFRQRDRELNPRSHEGRREADWLIQTFGNADGFTIAKPRDPDYWHSNGGPDEGRTEPHVHSPVPYRDAVASGWFTDNRGWFKPLQGGSLDLYRGPDLNIGLDLEDFVTAYLDELPLSAGVTVREKFTEGLREVLTEKLEGRYGRTHVAHG